MNYIAKAEHNANQRSESLRKQTKKEKNPDILPIKKHTDEIPISKTTFPKYRSPRWAKTVKADGKPARRLET